MLRFGSVVHLVGRYPELSHNQKFVKWMRTHAAQVWHEQASGSRTIVVVQSTDGLSLLAVEVDKRKNAEDQVAIHRVADINLLQNEMLRDKALLEFKRNTQIDDSSRLHSIRPVVQFKSDGIAEVQWEIDTTPRQDAKAPTTHRRSREGRSWSCDDESHECPDETEPDDDDLVTPSTDDLASNELHHIALLAADARTAIGTAATTEGKARGIFNYVSSSYIYDGTILNINDFTWSDYLTRDANGCRGVCDEWAVVQISMLRSVGIPARMKFLIWQQGGDLVAHACLEYRDGSSWKHMDALWNAFHNPQVYRNQGATNVTVMDADYPSDSRSTAPSWGIPDPTGDGKLNPYDDFVISPNFPGNSRSGYSY